jgi:hypothetical protein
MIDHNYYQRDTKTAIPFLSKFYKTSDLHWGNLNALNAEDLREYPSWFEIQIDFADIQNDNDIIWC